MDENSRRADAPVLVLASLAAGAKHGYAITQDIAEQVGVTLGPGTLYGIIARLEERGLIRALPSDDRRRPYELTAAGADALAERSRQLRKVADLGLKRLRTAGTA
ncbi:MAG TPA: PadR family transcriptional regulator [Jatrophihabitans sp.]|jgi:DNA-binding PadR family transcriptional regulator|uniref:PadR family transcriptional regulator n=1 Tax=Jatrophihabitans sp. TaxID=1932789 RepID=UPI002DFA420D|nr:PadR family transcriptional regulator [Jatrophihabitans sp.]